MDSTLSHPFPGLKSSICTKNIPKRSRNELKILNFLLYEKSGETVLKPFTRKDQSSTSICLNAPFYCFELVIRRRNSVIILYFFSFLGPFRGSVVREVGTV